jgi:hypothetical protein
MNKFQLVFPFLREFWFPLDFLNLRNRNGRHKIVTNLNQIINLGVTKISFSLVLVKSVTST